MISKCLHWRFIFTTLFLFVLNPAAKGEDTRVLWDISHGVEWDYSLEGSYRALGKFLGENGFVITKNQNELDNNLSPTQTQVLVLTVDVEEPYQKIEARNIKRFVQQGGGLLVLCDSPSYVTKSGINDIVSLFGVECGSADISSKSLTVRKFSHPFSEVPQVRLEYPGALKATIQAMQGLVTDMNGMQNTLQAILDNIGGSPDSSPQ